MELHCFEKAACHILLKTRHASSLVCGVDLNTILDERIVFLILGGKVLQSIICTNRIILGVAYDFLRERI